jgi:tRNA U34 2-thiouridine synthase MnmA/TrmU
MLRVSLDTADQGLAAGQYAVLYDDADRCVCCGVIRLVDEGNRDG